MFNQVFGDDSIAKILKGLGTALAFVIGVTAGRPVQADTIVPCDAIIYSTTWNLAGSPYIVNCPVSIYNGATLTVEAGVTVKFDTNGRLIFGYLSNSPGLLLADGTPASPITFTSLSGAVNGWKGLTFDSATDYNGAISTLDYCIIENAGVLTDGTWRANVRCTDTSQPTFSNCTIRNSGGENVILNSATSTFVACDFTGAAGSREFLCNFSSPTLTNCTFTTGAHLGLDIDTPSYSQPILSGCSFSGTGYYGLRVGLHSIDNGSFTTSGYIHGVQVLPSTLISSRRWNVPGTNQVYVVGSGELNIYNGATLTIDEGVTVKFDTNGRLIFGYLSNSPGLLVADGTPASPITFTSLSGAANGWKGLTFGNSSDYNGATSTLDYCIIEKAGVLTDGTWRANVLCIDTNQPTMTHCRILDSGAELVVCVRSPISISNSELVGTPGQAIVSNVGDTVEAANNWWGDVTGPYDPTNGNPDYNPSGQGESVSDYVVYRPWMNAPPDTYVLDVPVIGNGSVTVEPLQPWYAWGTHVTLTPVPAECSAFDHWSGDASGGTAPLDVVMNTDKSITATFAPSTFSIMASAGVGGAITPNGIVSVVCDSTQTFHVTADSCHTLANLIVDGASQGPLEDYTFTNVRANHDISAVFGLGTAATPERLEAWWTFDDFLGSNVIDLAHFSTHANLGTLLGGASIEPGIVGNALHCISVGAGMHVNVTGHSIFMGGRGFAVDAWIYLLPGSPSGDRRTIANMGSQSNSPDFEFYVQDLTLAARLNGTTFSAGGPPMSENAWHHVAIALYPSLGQGRFYLDGAPVGDSFQPSGGLEISRLMVGQALESSESFNGKIDEVDVFRASLSGPAADAPIIQRIWAAGCAGKRREFVRLPLWSDVCENYDTKSCAVFTNLTAITQTYRWELIRLVSGFCGGNPEFLPGVGTIQVPSGSLGILPIGISGTEYACFRMNVVSLTTGNAFFTEGYIHQDSQTCAAYRGGCVVPQAPRPVASRSGSPRSGGAEILTSTSRFTLYNEADASRSIPCRIEGVYGDTGERSEFISLNGLEWGAAVDQTVVVAAHDSVDLSVTVEVDTNNPFLLDQILLSADLDGDSVWEPLVAGLVEAVEDSTGGTISGLQDPSLTSTRLSVSPNPFRGLTSIHFSLAEPREVDVSVFDVAGRRVRSLHSGHLDAGAHELAWDGRESRGSRPMSGIYFIRVESGGLQLVMKVVQLRSDGASRP